jgi:hypothetical protein
MKIELNQDARWASELFDRLARDSETALGESDLIRQKAELLALLPYDLEPVRPRDEVWRRIEARIAQQEGEASPEDLSWGAPDLVRFPDRSGSNGPFPRPPGPLSAAAYRPAGRGGYAMAAELALCLVGLGILLAQSRSQRSTIEALRAEQARSLQVSHYYDMVRRTARQYYPLRPVSLSPNEKPYYGRVWVCGMHQQWLLNIEGLKPAPADHEYRFWFETEDGKVDGGRLEILDGEAQLAAASMPLGTKGFSVTLEAEGGPSRKPQGRVLLKAREAREIVLGIEDLGGGSAGLSM